MFKLTEELLFIKHLNQYKFRSHAKFLHYTCSNSNQNYYEVLGVPRGASQNEIKESYLKLCKLYHPDASNDATLSKDEKVKKFQRINEAYQFLSKIENKIAYDKNYHGHTFHSFTNQYPDRTKSYPRRPDGYRPYEEYNYQNSFQNKSQYSFYKRYDNIDNNYDRFRQEYDDALRRRGMYNQPTAKEILTFRIMVLSIIAIFIYIVGVRLFILISFRQNDVKKSEWENFSKRNINHDNRYNISNQDNLCPTNKRHQTVEALNN